MFQRREAPPRSRKKGIIIGGVVAAIIAAGGIAWYWEAGGIGAQDCPTAEEREYFSFVEIGSMAMTESVEGLQTLFVSNRTDQAWNRATLDAMVEVQRSIAALALYPAPPRLSHIQAHFVHQSAYMDEGLLYYASAIEHGMDGDRLEKANRAMRKSGDGQQRAVDAMREFLESCGIDTSAAS